MNLKEHYQQAKAQDRKALREFRMRHTKETKKLIRRLADACAVKEGTVQGWFLGYRKPDELAKQAIAKELKSTVKELFNE